MPPILLKSFLPAIAWFITLTILLCLPGSAFPQEDWLDKIWFDKWVHFGLFAGMVVLFCGPRSPMAGYAGWKKWFLFTAIIAADYGILMEFVQRYLIPNRSFDMGDIVADMAGAAAGYIIALKIFKEKS